MPIALMIDSPSNIIKHIGICNLPGLRKFYFLLSIRLNGGFSLSLDRIQRTSLWSRTLGLKDDAHHTIIDELRVSFLDFRTKCSILTSRIQGTLPNLTQHDITHLDALWEVAETICGEDYPINPLEAYIFGGAVLLHDSALCFEAYHNGILGVRETVDWKDAYSSLSDEMSAVDAEKAADFLALRALHAHQAEKLVNMSWTDPSTQQEIYLIENYTLRKAYGELIGQIAASHHWSIEDVQSKLSDQKGAIPGCPKQWRIDPIKIACLLRCADAAHIDNERAPDFLHALIKRRGISFSHWQAQNKLMPVDLDVSDSTLSTLIFNSTSDFNESESESWWIAYDTICMIDKEIRSSNALLESRQNMTPPFRAKRVKGVESPETMSRFVKATGWDPCCAEIHVGNIEHLVNSLGGEKLYGNGCEKFEIVLRELIQNAADSIRARKNFENGYVGNIYIHLNNEEDGLYLYVEDDGVGMSKRVLTGPLLDFGTSFWASSLVQTEFPGLRSSKFKSSGQFGIGFYSVFMAADQVTVSSRPWRGGYDSIWQLKFKNGLSLRPLLAKNAPSNFRHMVSTQVKLKLKEGILTDLNKIEVRRNIMGGCSLNVNINDYVSCLCAALDTSVYVKIDDSEYIEVHSDIRTAKNYTQWLKRISFSDYQSEEVNLKISRNAVRLRPIREGDIYYGLAAISIEASNTQDFMSIATISNLAGNIDGRDSDDYIGYIDYKPRSAQRDRGDFSAPKHVISSWVKEQIDILMKTGLTPLDKCHLAHSLVCFNEDPIDIANVIVTLDGNPMILSIEELASKAINYDVVILKHKFMEHVDNHANINPSHQNNKIIYKPFENSGFLSLNTNNGKPVNNYGILDCLYRKICAIGYTPDIKIEGDVGESIFGGTCDAVIVRALKMH
ncbi:ATP-binding protein [Aeromonas veronii]